MQFLKRFNETFSFKTEKPTGKWKAFDKNRHVIKYKKHEVGAIDDDKPHKIRLMVMKNETITDNNPNCAWKWITLKKDSESLEEAKTFLNQNFDAIVQKYTLHEMKD